MLNFAELRIGGPEIGRYRNLAHRMAQDIRLVLGL